MAKVRDDNLLEYFKTYGIEGCGISLHGVNPYDTGESYEDICEKICNSGVRTKVRYASLNGSIRGIGITPQEDEEISRWLGDYIWDLNQQVNVVIAYPQVIENSKGEKLYLGFTRPPKLGYDQDTECSFMDMICSQLGYVPKEFVLGYYIDTERRYGTIEPGDHIDYDVTINQNFNKINDELFDQMKDALGFYADISRAYAEHDQDTVEKFKNYFSKFGLAHGNVIKNSDNEVFGGRNRQY